MSVTETNQHPDANQRYLTIALAWLRLRLERLAPLDHPVQVPKPEQSQRHGLLGGWGTEAVQAPARPALSLDEQIARYASDLATIETHEEETPRLVALAKRLQLSRFERDVLLLCVAVELDTRIAALCAHAQDNDGRPYPTFALALALFDKPSWDIVSPERPLRYWRLIEIHQPDAQPITTSALHADERIVNYIEGLDYLDDRLATLVVPLEIEDGYQSLPPSQMQVVQAIIQHWQRADNSLPLIQLVGVDTMSKQLIAYAASGLLKRHLYRIPLEMLPHLPAEIELLARLWHRESLLLPLALYLDAQESDNNGGQEGQGQVLSRFLARSEGVFFLGTREPWSSVGRINISLDVEKPTPAEQQEAWTVALGEAAESGGEAEHSPAQLASQFNLNLMMIGRIAQTVLEEDEQSGDAEEAPSLADRLWNACRMSVRPRLDMLAQRLDLKATWDNLVLPQEETNILQQIADQVSQRSKVYEEWGFASRMNRGLGINALFVGESGTGKTMAAEVLANTLRLSLYRIDLSAVVSKFIGETEKNLRRLFDAAEDGGAILFFDEADALFGKRSEVKDSHDRYANIEINYLLQRMEAYRGLAILATNMKSALDPAFIRRLRFIINVPFPDRPERKRLWQGVFPPETPLDELDYDRLSRLSLTGGSIHNIALNAAFMAAHSNTLVTMGQILAATRAEFRKMERPVNEADFKLPPTTDKGA